jgi:hypothetical protein
MNEDWLVNRRNEQVSTDEDRKRFIETTPNVVETKWNVELPMDYQERSRFGKAISKAVEQKARE